MMICPQPVVSAVSMVAGVVRRRRAELEGPDIPEHLRPEAVYADPEGWHTARLAYGSSEWFPRDQITPLDWLVETRAVYRQTRGFK